MAFVMVKILTLSGSSGEISFSNAILSPRQENRVWFEEEHASNYMKCCSSALGFFNYKIT